MIENKTDGIIIIFQQALITGSIILQIHQDSFTNLPVYFPNLFPNLALQFCKFTTSFRQIGKADFSNKKFKYRQFSICSTC